MVYQFCHGPKTDHIVKLVARLATSIVEINVPEVKFDLKERVPLDFDTRLFVSGAAATYPELYKSCMEDLYINIKCKWQKTKL